MKYLVFILVLGLMSCEKYFVPDIDHQASSLTFQGFISDQPNVYTIKISKSISYNEDSLYENVTGFTVIIEDEFGGAMRLSENKPGLYSSDASDQGKIGANYRMVAYSPNGKTYASTWEKLNGAAPVDTIYGTYSEEAILRYYEETGYVEEIIPGVSVLNDVITKGFSPFYRYEYELVYQSVNTYPTLPFATYVYIAIPGSSFYGDFISTVNGNLYENAEIYGNSVFFLPKESWEERYPIDSVEIDSLGNEIFEEKTIRFQPMGFIVQLSQYSLSEEGFRFWDAIYKQSNSSGQVFDPIDTQIEGNIKNIDDSTEVVFGYFGASAITKKAMYLNLTNKQVRVKSAIYFPTLDGPIASYRPFDFWVN